MGDDTEMGSSFINPVIILPKGNIVKLVIDSRYLNSITDLSKCSRPLEPIGSLLTTLNGNYFITSDLCSAYNQVPLTEETKQLTSNGGNITINKKHNNDNPFCTPNKI